MTADNRSVDRKDLDAMTREFLDKGGKIVQCPPGSSDSVVYRKNSFRRRSGPGNGEAKPDGADAPAASPAPVPTPGTN